VNFSDLKHKINNKWPNEGVEFKSGDIIGCYHPSNVRYQVNTISGNGSSVYDCDGGNMTMINITNGNCILNPQRPIIQLLFGMFSVIFFELSFHVMFCDSHFVYRYPVRYPINTIQWKNAM